MSQLRHLCGHSLGLPHLAGETPPGKRCKCSWGQWDETEALSASLQDDLDRLLTIHECPGRERFFSAREATGETVRQSADDPLAVEGASEGLFVDATRDRLLGSSPIYFGHGHFTAKPLRAASPLLDYVVEFFQAVVPTSVAAFAKATMKGTAHGERSVYRTVAVGFEEMAGPLMGEPVGAALEQLGLDTRATVSEFLDAIEQHPKPSESEFRRLAREHPDRLARWVRSGTLQPNTLTFAAEALGEVEDSTLVARCLIPLLGHPSSVVREGAIYGLANHLEHPGVRNRLQDIADDDPREGVRQAASEALT